MTVSKDAPSYKDFECGDFVIVKNKPGYYRITKIITQTAQKNDYVVKFGKHKVGDVYSVYVTLEKLLDQEMLESRKSSSSVYIWNVKKIDRNWIKKAFKTLNDTLMMTLVKKERGEF